MLVFHVSIKDLWLLETETTKMVALSFLSFDCPCIYWFGLQKSSDIEMIETRIAIDSPLMSRPSPGEKCIERGG